MPGYILPTVNPSNIPFLFHSTFPDFILYTVKHEHMKFQFSLRLPFYDGFLSNCWMCQFAWSLEQRKHFTLQGCQNKPAPGAFDRLLVRLRRLLSMQSIQWIARLCCLCSARGQCLQCNKLDVATVLSSRLVDYIKEMSDRALNCATLLLELPSASSGRTCLLVEGVGCGGSCAAGGGAVTRQP